MPAPGENIRSWSVTAASNGNADSLIDWSEGQARASVNNSARSQMAAHAKWRDLINGSITTGGTANAQTFNSGLSYTVTPETGLIAKTKIGATLTNTAAMTLNMDSRGDVAVLGNDGNALVGGEVVAGSYVDWLWNGTNWIVLNGARANRSSFSAHKNGTNQTGVAASTETQITFGTEVYDLGDDFAANAWTPPAGKILIDAAYQASGTIAATATCNIIVYKNGAAFRKVGFGAQPDQVEAAISIMDVATGSDVYTIYAYVGSTGAATLTGTAASTWFMGAVID